jgi:hypothetical protein
MSATPVVILNPPNHLLRIDAVWIAISVDEHGNEGVCAAPFVTPEGVPMTLPLIAADEARLPWVRENAWLLAMATGRKVKLIRLATREEVETYEVRKGGRQ